MVRISLLVLTASLATTLALPQNYCTAVCRPVKPECPAGEVATGSENCWGCCQPVSISANRVANATEMCTAVCRPEKPECPAGEAPTGQEGCWGCCAPITKTEEHICTRKCRLEKPECPAGEVGSVFAVLCLHVDSNGYHGRPPPGRKAVGDAASLYQNVRKESALSSAPTGSEGCWGCCQPITASEKREGENDGDMCLAVCQEKKPECPAGEAPTGSEGCWGCCQPNAIAEKVAEGDSDVCMAVCQEKKPECPAGEAPTGQEGCWGCCTSVALVARQDQAHERPNDDHYWVTEDAGLAQ
ncbi:hypothetical protein AN8544.2 [Aspergillus nidulans FGSC A4]|nr:hypothetical protein AN8544.2 [Aspergillus nidulans FGSC A4]|eukprot:XP_681813.1 hypothetical protein AN8544.2 [Aspergillus nidulans FGSC A4]